MEKKTTKSNLLRSVEQWLAQLYQRKNLHRHREDLRQTLDAPLATTTTTTTTRIEKIMIYFY